jgi:ComF family protein
VLDYLFPPICLGCERESPPGPLWLGLCLPCRGRLEALRGGRCAGCGRPLVAAALPAGYLCGHCRRRPPAFDRLLAAWSYAPPLEQVIHALKFGRLDFLGAHLAEELWRRLGGELRAVEAVVPVPLHWRRQLVRGYNQAERIARPLARHLDRPLVRALRRRRPTPPQARLPRSQRQANLRRAFRGRRSATIAGRPVLLVDDVATTGATLDEAAAALKRLGAASVMAVAAARTPAPGPTPRGDRAMG